MMTFSSSSSSSKVFSFWKLGIWSWLLLLQSSVVVVSSDESNKASLSSEGASTNSNQCKSFQLHYQNRASLFFGDDNSSDDDDDDETCDSGGRCYSNIHSLYMGIEDFTMSVRAKFATCLAMEDEHGGLMIDDDEESNFFCIGSTNQRHRRRSPRQQQQQCMAGVNLRRDEISVQIAAMYVPNQNLSMDINLHYQQAKDQKTTKDRTLMEECFWELLRYVDNEIDDDTSLAMEMKSIMSRGIWTLHHHSSSSSSFDPNDDQSTQFLSNVAAEEASSVETLVYSIPRAYKKRIYYNPQEDLSVWEVLDYDVKAETNNNSTPKRYLFHKDRLWSSNTGEVVAHVEALVHPALNSVLSAASVVSSNDNHREEEETNKEEEECSSDDEGLVVVIASKEPTALVQQVLKYQNIGKVFLVGANKAAMGATAKYLPEWNDCSFLVDTITVNERSSQCMDQDDRLIFVKDPAEWMTIQHPSHLLLIDVPLGEEEEWIDLEDGLLCVFEFDQVILPETMVVFSMGVTPPLQPLSSSSSSFGIHQSQRRNMTVRDYVLTNMESWWKDYIFVYDEPMAQPFATSYVVLAQSLSTSYSRFIRTNSPAIELDLVHNLHPNLGSSSSTTSSSITPPTTLYDGGTHVGYLSVARSWEQWYCHQPLWKERAKGMCHDFLSNWYNPSHHWSKGEVRDHPIKGRAYYAQEDIPQGYFVSSSDTSLSITFDLQRWEALQKFVQDFPEATMYSAVMNMVDAYGYESTVYGEDLISVSIGSNMTFVNHACTEREANVASLVSLYSYQNGNATLFSPPLWRRSTLLSRLAVSTRTVQAGEELAQDYGEYATTLMSDEYVLFLKRMCDEGIGDVPVKQQQQQQQKGDGESKE